MEGWPIEVGLSSIDKNLDIQTFDSLIRPVPEWPEHAWSPASAAVHGIPRSELDAAPDVKAVAADLLAAVNGRVALSDAVQFDNFWLYQLLDAADVSEPVSVYDFDAVTLRNFPPDALDHLYERLARTRVPHRAGPDSARMARAWVAGVKKAHDGSGSS